MPREFHHPEIPGRDHVPIAIPEDVFERIECDFLDNGEIGYPESSELEITIPTVVSERFGDFEDRNAHSPVENLLIVDERGTILWERRGDSDSVAFPDSLAVRGSFAIHNHPNGSPPSVTDAERLIDSEFRIVRIVAPPRWDYTLVVGENGSDLAGFVFHFRSIDQQSWAVAEECIAKHGLSISDEERFCRRQHSIFMELARMGYLCYSRRRWTNRPESSGKSG